jgi:lipid A 3-O-deacylase
MRPAKPLVTALLFSCLISAPLCPTSLAVPSPDEVLTKGSSEWGLQAGGGLSVAGGVQQKSYGMLIGRWGKILTHPMGKGPIRGNLQYSVEIIPVMIVSQSSMVYTAGISPLQLRYNFAAGRCILPFFEIGGAVLVSKEKVPENTSRVNFLTFGGAGVHIFKSQKTDFQMGMRFQHISNAGIADLNPGINTLYFFLGLSRFAWRR